MQGGTTGTCHAGSYFPANERVAGCFGEKKKRHGQRQINIKDFPAALFLLPPASTPVCASPHSPCGKCMKGKCLIYTKLHRACHCPTLLLSSSSLFIFLSSWINLSYYITLAAFIQIVRLLLLLEHICSEKRTEINPFCTLNRMRAPVQQVCLTVSMPILVLFSVAADLNTAGGFKRSAL